MITKNISMLHEVKYKKLGRCEGLFKEISCIKEMWTRCIEDVILGFCFIMVLFFQSRLVTVENERHNLEQLI